MTGILVQGDNHFIVEGSTPSDDIARRLARHWSVIQIGGATPPDLAEWRIVNKAFRENLEWAIVIEDAAPNTEAVLVLLREMKERGIEIRRMTLI
jgi:hypothetical protein